MGKLSTTCFTLLALRLMLYILTTFTMETPQQMPTFGVFFVTFNYPRSFNLSECTITFSIIPVRSVWSNMRRFLRWQRYLILWIIMVNGDVNHTNLPVLSAHHSLTINTDPMLPPLTRRG